MTTGNKNYTFGNEKKEKILDSKDRYSTSVLEQKERAKKDLELLRTIMRGKKRGLAYSHEWQPININEIIEKFALGIEPELKGGKMIWNNFQNDISIVSDIGGSYLRIMKISNGLNYGLDGNLNLVDVRNYTDINGKQHGRPKSERQKLTHFRIKFRSEM